MKRSVLGMWALSGPRFLGTVRSGGRGIPTPPPLRVYILYSHMLTLSFVSVLRLLGQVNASKFYLFPKCLNQNLNFWIFSKSSFRNKHTSPFSSYFDTQHSICEIFIQLNFLCRGVPGEKSTSIKKIMNDKHF